MPHKFEMATALFNGLGTEQNVEKLFKLCEMLQIVTRRSSAVFR